MDSQEAAKNTSLLQVSSYMSCVNNLSPIESVKTTHASSSPPLVFTSPRVNPQPIEISPSDNGVNSLDDSKKSSCQSQKDFDSQNVSTPAPLSVDDYLVDYNVEEPLQPTHVYQHCDAQGGMSRRCLQFNDGAVAVNVNSFPSDMPALSFLPPEPEIYIWWHLQRQAMSMPHAATTNARRSLTYDDSIQPITYFDPASVQGKRTLTYENSGNSQQLNQQRRPENKRQKTSSSDGATRRQCNCKKSQCLKLYCDCFSSGNYCAENCACQGCYNRLEYAETVEETRNEIRCRNPFAFRNIDDVDQRTSSSPRLRKGCNCKKSTCTKRYCVCFQANVGCSSACRCEECKNIYGQKDHAATEHAWSQQKSNSRVEIVSESGLHNNMEMVTNQRDSFHNLHQLTAVLQFPDSLEAAAIAMFSPEPIPSERRVIPERNEMSGSGSYGCQLDSNNMEITNQTLAGRCNSVPSQLHQLTLTYPRTITSHANNPHLSSWPMIRNSDHLGRNNRAVCDIVEDQTLCEIALTPNTHPSAHLRSRIVKSMPALPLLPPSVGRSHGNDHQDSGSGTCM